MCHRLKPPLCKGRLLIRQLTPTITKIKGLIRSVPFVFAIVTNHFIVFRRFFMPRISRSILSVSLTRCTFDVLSR